MKRTIITGLEKLELAGVSLIAMPCNAAHIYFRELQAAIQIPLLNMVAETVKHLPQVSQKATLFATCSTFESALYQNNIINTGHEFVFKAGIDRKYCSSLY